MHVDYSLEFDDLVQFNLFVLERSATVRRQRLIMRLLVPAFVIAIAALLLSYSDGAGRTLPIIMFGVATGLFLLYPKIIRSGVTRNVRHMLNEGSNEAVLGFRRLTIGPDEITQAARLFATTWKWEAIDRISESADAAYFHVSAMSAILLPKRAFATIAEYEAFVRSAQQFHYAATAHAPGIIDQSA